MVAIFAAWNALCICLGVRIDAGGFHSGWHFVDPELLKSHLWESLYYLHSQPPGYNLLIGIVLKLFPSSYLAVFQAIYVVIGAVLYLATYALMRKLGVDLKPAFILSTVFMMSPAYVAFEAWLFYTFPVACLLVLSALSLIYYFETSRAVYVAAFNACLFCVCMMNAMFHLVFYAAIVTWLVLAMPKCRRQTLATACLPLVLICAVYFKNYKLTGMFTSSTWIGLNVASNRTNNVPIAEREELVREGKLTKVSLVEPASDPLSFPQQYFVNTSGITFPGWAALRNQDGSPNRNQFGFVQVSRDYMRDTMFLLRHQPRYFVHGIVDSVYHYFMPPLVSGTGFYKEGAKLKGMAWLYAIYDSVDRRLVIHRGGGDPMVLFPVLIIYLLSTLVWSCKLAFSRVAAGSNLTESRRRTVQYMCFIIGFVMVVGWLNAVENNRMRFSTDPLSVVLFGLCCKSIQASIQARTTPRTRETVSAAAAT